MSLQAKYFNRRRDSHDKDPVKLQRIAAHIEERLVDFLSKRFPKDSFPKQQGERRLESDFAWHLNPLDGQRNFAHCISHFCALAGISFRSTPVCGVVYQPCSEDSYQAIAGGGAYKNKQHIYVSQTNKIERAITASGLPYDYERRNTIDHILCNLAAFIGSGTGLRRSGSAVLDLCWIAEGLFDAFWEHSFKAQDLCAVIVILQEAGAMLSDFEGKAIDHLVSSNLLASNTKLHDTLLELLQQVQAMGSIN